MICDYCKSDKQSGSNCERCGAPISVKKNAEEKIIKSEPFFYDGYIVYMIKNFTRNTVECQFWLGMQLIERIELDIRIIDERVPEGCDVMPFFWDLFLLAHGEKEVLEWKDKNNKYPASFEVRYIPNRELEDIRALSYYDLAQAARK